MTTRGSTTHEYWLRHTSREHAMRVGHGSGVLASSRFPGHDHRRVVDQGATDRRQPQRPTGRHPLTVSLRQPPGTPACEPDQPSPGDPNQAGYQDHRELPGPHRTRCIAGTYPRRSSRTASASQAAAFSNRCITSALDSPATSASVHPFLDAIGASNPVRYARARRRGSGRPNRPATRANSHVDTGVPAPPVHAVFHRARY
jgi:hypothetical protein